MGIDEEDGFGVVVFAGAGILVAVGSLGAVGVAFEVVVVAGVKSSSSG